MDHPQSAPEIQQSRQESRGVDSLSFFRESVGIHALPKGKGTRVSQNVGVYKRVLKEERKAQFKYYAFASLINICLLLQIVFGATLTALGASKGPHIAVTVIGATNTVVASILSFTKGQGLPNRLRQYQNALRKVREYIEQCERELAQPDCDLDMKHEVRTVIELYEAARQNEEDNDPNAYTNPRETPANGRKSVTPETSAPLSTTMDKLGTMLKGLRHEDGQERSRS